MKLKYASIQISPTLAAIALLCLLGNQSDAQWIGSLKPNAVVAADGSGTHKTVQEAINAAPARSTQRFFIQIKPGTYKEKLTIPKNKGPITLYSDNANTAVLTYADYAGKADTGGKPLRVERSYSVSIDANDFAAENVTFENTHRISNRTGGKDDQAVALSVGGDRAVFRKCRFIGWQDTMYLRQNRQYFEDCYISGQVDYIFGEATAFFDRCELHCVAKGVAITAAATARVQQYGYVFLSCKITTEPLSNWITHLGRPLKPSASVTYLNTEMADVVAPEGWDNWGTLRMKRHPALPNTGTLGRGRIPKGAFLGQSN
jgi:pectinesterase